MRVRYGGQAAAGNVLPFPIEAAVLFEMFLPEELSGENVTFYKVLGDSLETDNPETCISDGDFLVTRPARSIEEVGKSLCVVTLNGSETVAKRINGNGGGVVLSPANHKYEPLKVEPDNLGNIDIVLYFMRRARL